MSDRATEPRDDRLVFTYDLDAPPEKVWRAISIEEFRAQWLPTDALADRQEISATPGREIRYRMRDDAPPYLESVVTFRISPNPAGGARLEIIHEIADARLDRETTAANDNAAPRMRAA